MRRNICGEDEGDREEVRQGERMVIRQMRAQKDKDRVISLE
jgi:hypothetical protein